MNIQIQLVGELKDETLQKVLNVLADHNGCAPAKAAPAAAAKKQAETAEQAEEEVETKSAKPAAAAKGPAKPAAKAAAPAKTAKPAAAKEEAVDFESMDEEAQLAELVRFATTFTKKGKTADIKLLLGIFDAGRTTELDPAVYGEFYDLLNRYKGGEAAEDLVAENEV